MDQEEVRNIFSKNDLIEAPVLENDNKLVGRITADRIIEVAEEEAAEDLFTMAGTDADELDTASVFRAARVRMTWLLPCIIGTAITAMVMMFFKGHNPVIYVAAVAFVPMIAAISGNAGLQTSAIVVSGLATGHLVALRLGQVFAREVRIAIIVALSCGVIGGVACAFLLYLKAPENTIKSVQLVFAFGTAMFSAIMVYVLGNNGSDNTWFVSAVFIPPNPYRPGDKLRAISYNRKRLDKCSNLYDFDTAVGNVSTEGALLLQALLV
jgi:magnesium transporter